MSLQYTARQVLAAGRSYANAAMLTVAAAISAGCATPADTRNAFSELNRLCETEAGIRVYRPELWPAKLGESKYIPCAAGGNGATCVQYREAGLFSIGVTETAYLSGAGSVVKLTTQFFREIDNMAVAEMIEFLGHGKNPWLADSPSQQKHCKLTLRSRVLPS